MRMCADGQLEEDELLDSIVSGREQKKGQGGCGGRMREGEEEEKEEAEDESSA